MILPVDHEYWRQFPMREHPECKCRVRQVSKREYERLLREGIPDPDAPPVLDANGNRTGHIEPRTIPAKLVPSG